MLQVSVPIAHELLGQCIKQSQALVQRASLVGDFSDYESWKAARAQWIEPTAQALAHIYGEDGQAREFTDAATPNDGGQRWQQQYSSDLECVKAATEYLTVLQSDLAFTKVASARPSEAPELSTGSAENAEDTEDAEGAEDAEDAEDAERDDRGAGQAAPEPSAAAAADDAEPAASNDNGQAPEPAASQDDGRAPEPREDAAAQEAPAVPADEAEPEPAGEPSIEARRAEPASAERSSPLAAATLAPERRAANDPSEHDPETHRQPGTGAELSRSPLVGASLAHHTNGSAPAESTNHVGRVPAQARQVFLAHGRNELWKQAVAHLLEHAGSDEITILNERPSERATLVQQIGEHAPGSRYAIVLLTADDVGAPRKEAEAEPYFTPRAHQGVVFEMGFLVAALTPDCVCVLYEDGVEVPCDLEGIAYVRLDLAGTWQPKLLLHLRKAGFDYDLNRLVSV